MEHTHSAMIVCSSSKKSVITMMENMNYVMSVGKKITNVNRPYAEDIFSNNEYKIMAKIIRGHLVNPSNKNNEFADASARSNIKAINKGYKEIATLLLGDAKVVNNKII